MSFSQIDYALCQYEKRISLLEPDLVDIQLSVAIGTVAKKYGARTGINQVVLEGCIELITEKFAGLSIDEIEEAYKQKMSGEIEVQGGEMYGGEFNVSNFGAVISAYSKKRNRIISQYQFELQEQKEQKELRVKRSKEKQIFEEMFSDLIENESGQIEKWEDVPDWVYKICNDRGMIEFEKGEAVAIYEEAQIIYAQRSKEKQTKLMKQRFSDKTIAQKITVFRKIIKNTNA